MVINKNWTFTNTSIGPDKWKDKYATCNTSFQSPINIITNNVARCEMECSIEFQYFPGKCKVKSMVNQYNTDKNSRSIIFYLEYNNGSYVIFNGITYVLTTIHFFPGGLHNIDNGKYDMEAVLSHSDQSVNILNISVLIIKSTDFGDSQNFFSQWTDNLNNLSKEDKVYKEQLDTLLKDNIVTYSVDETWSVNNLLPVNRAFYYYLGSAVFPPCKGDIKWLVLKEAVDILYNDLLPFIKYANKTFQGSDGKIYSEPMRDIQPNPSFVSGKKVERIVYENNNSNNGNIKKEKIYIKCQKVKKSGSSSNTSDSGSSSGDSSGSSRKFSTGGFFNSTLWKIFTYLCYIIINILAVYLAYKTIKWIYDSGKFSDWQQWFSGGGEVCMPQGEFEKNFPCNSNDAISPSAPQPFVPGSQINYGSPINQNITRNSIKSDSQFLKDMLNFGQQTTTISGGGETELNESIFPSINLGGNNINMDIKDIGNGNLLDFI